MKYSSTTFYYMYTSYSFLQPATLFYNLYSFLQPSTLFYNLLQRSTTSTAFYNLPQENCPRNNMVKYPRWTKVYNRSSEPESWGTSVQRKNITVKWEFVEYAIFSKKLCKIFYKKFHSVKCSIHKTCGLLWGRVLVPTKLIPTRFENLCLL